ncbi:MAG: ATP-binding protein [Chryseolinea sp.]
MKATDTSQICPYTGLRSFTEEESLYFKGRDEQVDEVAAQLEERKFLMLTGASGEGKSSLIYAGLIPNARAGFFRAKFGHWQVVDFRPERSPVKNFSKAVASAFSVQESTIETEMRRGFSSLTDLYINSDFYVNDRDEAWLSLSDAEKKSKKRNTANLLILVDQFEEFFTNPENYYNESPSQDSQVVVNLILETARIALQQNLPIYIVCTMRSDYIGQCSSFRGLAEYIGYSQFFVPRLKRKQLKQVIEDPALLSGNRITQRLADRLVYDLAEGVDQLPILQHALSRIWLEANRGADEMDLIHYAMVGGMSASELPEEDKLRFDKWFTILPEYQQSFYSETGIHKVIENHANGLYESAAEYYNAQNPGSPIDGRDAKNIVALTFSCLTRIDNSRAVRNRMTLGEIAGIINRPNLTADVIGKVLRIFREEGNSFIRPFKTELHPDLAIGDVLDITHESLIRNWARLNKWATQEFNYYSTFLDLNKQLGRWKSNNKSSGYLLPIGPLTYFENWYSTAKPNAGWINRYSERADDPSETMKQSQNLLEDLREFLGKSAKHVSVSRAFVKYGAGKIALAISAVVLLALCGWYWFEAERKKKGNVVAEVQADALTLLKSREVTLESKGFYLIANERLSPGSSISFIKSIRDRNERVLMYNNAYRQLILTDKKFSGKYKEQLIDEVVKEFNGGQGSPAFELEQRIGFIYSLAYDRYYQPRPAIDKTLSEKSSELFPLLVNIFKTVSAKNVSGVDINRAIQHWLTFGNPSISQVKELVDVMSPFASEQAKSAFDSFYPRGSFEPDGLRPIDYNGGYHTLASLYAALGDTEKIKLCFKALSNQADYFTGKLFNDYSNIIGYLYQYGHRGLVAAVANEIQIYYPANRPLEVLRDLVIRSGYITHFYRLNYFPEGRNSQTEDGNFYLNLCLSDRKQFLEIVADYEKVISEIRESSERNYLLAIHFKRVAIYESKYSFDRGLEVSQSYLDGLLDKAWSYFTHVGDDYLAGSSTVEYRTMGKTFEKTMTRRAEFVYPDYLGGWLSRDYHTELFYKYLEKKGLLTAAFKTPEDLEQIHVWIANSDWRVPFLLLRTLENSALLSDATLMSAVNFATNHPSGKYFDGNLLHFILANRSFERGDTTAGLTFYKRIDLQNIRKSASMYEPWRKTSFRNNMMQLAKYLALSKHLKESIQMIERLDNNVMRLNAYAFIADHVYDNNYDPNTFVLLDSAFSKWKRLANPSVPGPLEYRNRLIEVVEKIGSRKMKALSKDILRNTPEERKVSGVFGLVKANCERGDFYSAMTSIPPSLTENQDLNCKGGLLWYAATSSEKATGDTQWAGVDAYYARFDYILFLGLVF